MKRYPIGRLEIRNDNTRAPIPEVGYSNKQKKMTTEKAYTPLEEQVDIQFIRDHPFAKNEFFMKENIETALEFVPRDDDIIISTYPKTGTNWIKYLVWEILNKGAPLPSTHDLHFLVAPILEATGASVAENLPPPRLLQFHVPYHLIPKNASAKYIYMTRNPKDTLISYFHFMKIVGAEKDLSFNDFFERFSRGNVPFGNYFDHVLSWYAHKDDPNILILSYEQLKADSRKELFKIAEFLGEKYLNMLQEDEELTETILERTSFGYMKKNLDAPDSDQETTQTDKETTQEEKRNIPKFFRKGIVGDWEKHFSPEQNERFEKLINEKFKDCDISKFWDFC